MTACDCIYTEFCPFRFTARPDKEFCEARNSSASTFQEYLEMLAARVLKGDFCSNLEQDMLRDAASKLGVSQAITDAVRKLNGPKPRRPGLGFGPG